MLFSQVSSHARVSLMPSWDILSKVEASILMNMESGLLIEQNVNPKV